MTSLTEGNLSQLVKKQDRSQMKKGASINIITNGNMSNYLKAFCLKLVSIKIWKTRTLKDDQYKVICFKIIRNKNVQKECIATGISKLFQHCTLVLISTQIRFGRLNWIGKKNPLKELRNPILRIILVWSLFCLNGFMQVCPFYLFLFFW